MALAINSNFGVNATFAVSNMKNSQALMSKNMNHISSGKKAPRPVDDVVSYVKGIKLKGEAQEALSKYNTLQDEASKLNVVDAAYAAATDILLEMQGLEKSGALSGSASSAGAAAYKEMATALAKLADSSGQSSMTSTYGVPVSAAGGIPSSAFSSGASSQLAALTTKHAALGGAMTALDKIANFLSDKASLKEAHYEAVTEVDLAREMTSYVKNNIQTQAAQSMVAQANQGLAQTINLLQF